MTRVFLPRGPRFEGLAAALEEAGFEPVPSEGPLPVPPARFPPRPFAAVVPPQGLEPWRRLAPSRRRRVVVTAVVPEGRTADPLTALGLGVNLVVAEADLARLPQLLRAAVADHLRLVALLEPELAR